MRTYKRLKIQGGTYFFTLTLAERRSNDLLVHHISAYVPHFGKRWTTYITTL